MDELLNYAPCGYLSFTDGGLIADVNATLLELLEYTRDELAQQKLETVLTVSSSIFLQTHFFPLLRLHGRADEIFFSLRTKSKKSIPVLVNAVRREQAGEPINVCAMMVVAQRQSYETQILEAKRAAEEALRSNEALSKAKQELEERALVLDRNLRQLEQKNREHLRVSQILFHDLWEPLRRIFTFADLLQQGERTVDAAQRQSWLGRILSAASRMESLLRSLQEYVAVDTADETLAQVDLNEAVARAQRTLANRGQPCEIISTALPIIEGYPQQLVLLFSHLMENSVKFCQPAASPTIQIRHSLIQQNWYRNTQNRYRYVEFVKIIIEDNSCGFDNEYSQQVFELLRKLDPTTPGMGIGLAICQKVVENHFGSITLASQVGKGVTITIQLPCQQ